MAFPHSDLQIKVYAYLGADPTADPSTWPEPVDLTGRLLDRDIGLRTGRQPGQRTAAAGQLTLLLDNDDGALTPGLVTSPYFGRWHVGVPVAVDVGNLPGQAESPLFRGHLAEIKVEIVPTVAGPTSAARVTLGGIFRRLGQGKVLQSAVRRFHDPAIAARVGRKVPVGYWPMDHGQPSARDQAQALIGPQPLRLIYTSGEAAAKWSGSELAPWLGSGLQVDGTMVLSGQALEESATPTVVAADVVFRNDLPGGSSASFSLTLQSAATAGGNVFNYFVIGTFSSGMMALELWRETQTLMADQMDAATAELAAALWDGRLHHLRLLAMRDGSDVDVEVYLDGTLIMSGTHSSATLWLPEWRIVTVGQVQATVGHGALWAASSTADIESAADVWDAVQGHAGESARTRVRRICAEEGIPHETWLPEPFSDIRLGPQPLGTVLDVLRDAERAGQGFLYELTSTWGVGYRPLRARYRQPASLVIDLAKYRVTGNTGREVLQPVWNDARLRNEVTVSRPNGAEATARDGESIAKYGHYRDAITANVVADEALRDQAGWWLHLLNGWRVREGTFGGLQYSSLSIDLGANPNLITPWLLTRLGDRIDRVNHSGQHPTGTVSLALEGYSATIRPREWQIQANVEPYTPWETPQYVGPNGGRLLPMSGSVSTTGAGSQVNLDFTGLSVDFRGERPKMLRLVLEVDDPDELGNISLFLGVGGFTDNIRWLFHVASTGASAFLPGQRTAVILQLSEIHSVGGSITLSPRGAPSVMFGYTHARLAVTDKGNGQPVTVTLHSAALVSASDPGPFVSITFDDGLASVSSLAWPKMRELGLRGTEYPIVEVVGDSGRVTLDELRERYEAGWEIGGHSYAATVHTGRYTGVNAAQALADMQANIAWLEQHFPARAYTMAYPGGEFTETIDGQSVEDIIVAAGYAAARTTLSNPGSNTHLQIESMPPPIMTRLYAASGIWDGASGQQNPANLLATGGMLDRVEALGGWLILVFHDIVEGTPTNSLEVSKADFDAIMESLASRAVTVLPVREVLALLPKRRAKYQVKGCSTIQGLWLRGASDSYVSTPSATPLQITGDLDVRAYIRPASWTPATAQHIVSKDNPSGNQRGYRLRLNTDGTISLLWSPNGVDTLSVTSTAAPTVGPTGARAIRAVLDVNNGSGGHTVTFYEAATLDGPWTQLGSSGSDGSGTTSIFATTAELRIGVRGDGTQPFAGVIHAVEVRSGIDGTVVADPDFTDHDTGDTSISDDAGNTWTVQANAEIVDSLDTSNLPSKLMVVTTAGPTLTTDAAQMPLYIECAGVELEVTEVEGTGRPQVLTVASASVPKTIGPGETVTLSDRPVYAL